MSCGNNCPNCACVNLQYEAPSLEDEFVVAEDHVAKAPEELSQAVDKALGLEEVTFKIHAGVKDWYESHAQELGINLNEVYRIALSEYMQGAIEEEINRSKDVCGVDTTGNEG